MASSSAGAELTPEELLKASFYDVLGVPKNATNDDIKRGYRKMALKYHPDKVRDQSQQATEVFQRIKFAFETLSDDNKRAVYDEWGEKGLTIASSAGPLAVSLIPPLHL